MTLCRICGSSARVAFRKKVLSKHDVQYFHCDACGFLATETPWWLKEAYSEALMGLRDVGMVQRNLHLAEVGSRLIFDHFDPAGTFLDYGGGTGLLVRLMRDRGLDFRYHDPYARNLFARLFEAPEPVGGKPQYELLTAIEVFEHTPDPIDEVRKMLAFSDTILFTTELQPAQEGSLEDWNYLFPESGQHVAFYSQRTLETIARALSLRLMTDSSNLHLLTVRRDLIIDMKALGSSGGLLQRFLRWTHRRLGNAVGLGRSRPTLIHQDAIHVREVLRVMNDAGEREPKIDTGEAT